MSITEFQIYRMNIVSALKKAGIKENNIFFNKDTIPVSFPSAFVVLESETGILKTSKRYLDSKFSFVIYLIISSEKAKDPPPWHNEPVDPNWHAFYNMLFRIQKSDLYLGLHSQIIKDNLLLKDAFYHAPDQDNILRTYIYDGKNQIYEGMKV